MTSQAVRWAALAICALVTQAVFLGLGLARGSTFQVVVSAFPMPGLAALLWLYLRDARDCRRSLDLAWERELDTQKAGERFGRILAEELAVREAEAQAAESGAVVS